MSKPTAVMRLFFLPFAGLVASLALFAAPESKAQDAPGVLPSVRSFFRNEDVAAMRLSPSGKWLAMTVGGGSTRVALAVVGTEKDAAAPNVIAAFNDQDVASFRWVGDDRLVFNLVDTDRGGREQRFGPGLFSVPREGGNPRELIRASWQFFRNVSRTANDVLDPSHRLLAVPRDGSTDVIVGQYRFNARNEVESIDALRLDIASGRVRSISGGRPEHVKQWFFDPKGEPRVTVSDFEGTHRVWWREPGQERWRQIDESASLEPRFDVAFVDEAGRLYVTTPMGKDGIDVLRRFDFSSDRPEGAPLVSAPGFDFQGSLVSDSLGNDVFGVRMLTDAETTVWFDPRMKALQKLVDERLPGRVNSISCSRCKDPELLLVHSWSDQDPGTYLLYRPKSDAWSAVGRARPDIATARMATLDLVRVKGRDGLELPVWITTPRKDAPGLRDGKRPAVVLVHGGPWTRGGWWHWDADAQFLASRGYVVIEPEFRGSTGYGSTLFRAGWKQWAGAMQDDVADALRAVAAKALVDPQRVCIAGASYGGYATLMGLARYGELYRCGVAWVAVTDPRLMFEDAWESDMSDDSRNIYLPSLVGDPVKDAAMLKAAAPVEHATDIKAPLLMAFGRDDRRVPLKHGTLMREALKAQGRDPQWVVYDGEGHGWLKVQNRVDFWTRVERFLGAQIGGGISP